ncbi:MAG: hypothetical protein AAGJ37_04490 [Pseudomonadota bacterium]
MESPSESVVPQSVIVDLIKSKKYQTDSVLYAVFFTILWYVADGFLLGNTSDFGGGLIAYFISSVIGVLFSILLFFALGRFFVNLHFVSRLLFKIVVLFGLLLALIELGITQHPLIISKMIAVNFLVHGLSINRIKKAQ